MWGISFGFLFDGLYASSSYYFSGLSSICELVVFLSQLDTLYLFCIVSMLTIRCGKFLFWSDLVVCMLLLSVAMSSLIWEGFFFYNTVEDLFYTMTLYFPPSMPIVHIFSLFMMSWSSFKFLSYVFNFSYFFIF